MNKKKTLSNVLQFLIKKAIDCVCGGEVELEKLLNGSILRRENNALLRLIILFN